MLYPLKFHPIFKERIWGGRNLETLYGKSLPPARPIGESWEITDRPDAVSVIANGALAGKDLRWLIENHGPELYGSGLPSGPGFPLLIKILDACDVLSLQVHPPAAAAATLGGEPKTEMWYIAHAEPQAKLFVGLKQGVTRELFERKLNEGTAADCVPSLPVQAGDAMFLPSGRLHAIGGGQVIFEIQQNSDTTYRVFDWNRVDQQTGQSRQLHIRESLASIDFNDFDPPLITSKYSPNPNLSVRYIVNDPLFSVDAFKVKRHERFHLRNSAAFILGILKGRLVIRYKEMEIVAKPGEFVLIPGSLERTSFYANTQVELLHIQFGKVNEN